MIWYLATVKCDTCTERFSLLETTKPNKRIAYVEAKIRGWKTNGPMFICKKCQWRSRPKITMADILPVGRAN